MSFSTDLFLEYKKQPGRPALARLLEHHQDAVYSLCLQVLRHPQDAEDACQEVLLEVSRQLDAVEEPMRFPGWLYRTALNTALDVRRKRGRERVREARARRPSQAVSPQPESDEALHERLAGLDDSSRMLVVEHYLAALSSLEGIAKVSAPAGLVRKALGLKGGLAMAAKGGISLAIVAPLLLLGVAGTLVYLRRGEPPPMTMAVLKPTAAVQNPDTTVPSPSALAVFTPPPRPTKTPQAAPRRPYPFKAGALAASKIVHHTWWMLSSKQIALYEENASLAEVLEKVGKLTGLSFRFDPTLKTGERVTFQIQPPCPADQCLQLLLDNWAADFEILSDGTLHVGSKSSIPGGFEREARKMEATDQEIRNAGGLMDGGWDGIRDLHDPSVLKAKTTTIPQGESSLQEEVDRMFEDQVFVRVDVPVDSAENLAASQAMINRRFLQVAGERTVGEHVEQLAKLSGLVAVTVDGNLLGLTTEEKAAGYRAKEDQRRRDYKESATALEKAFRESGSFLVQDFLEVIPRSVGVQVVPSEEVWDSSATLTLPPGATLREGLDLLKAEGYRWALRNGKIWVFK